MSSTPSAVFRVQHDTDPAEDIKNALGDIKGFKLGPGKLLLGIYKRPEKIGLILRPTSAQTEDIYQGKAWLIVAEGPLCFIDTEQSSFGGFRPKVGDWVLARNNDGYRMDIGSDKTSGHECLIIQDRYIKATLKTPWMVW